MKTKKIGIGLIVLIALTAVMILVWNNWSGVTEPSDSSHAEENQTDIENVYSDELYPTPTPSQAIQSDALPPLWLAHPQFQNHNQPRAASTSGILATRLSDLWSYPEIRGIMEFYQGIRQHRLDWIYPSDPVTSDLFKDIFRQGFEEDRLSQIMPFNLEFLEQILLDVHVYLARPHGGQPDGGLVWHNHGRSDMFISIGGTHRDFAFLGLHEMAHALGLGESLADLFAEEFMGLPYSVRSLNNRNISSVFGGVRVFSQVGGLYYNSNFDRALLRILEQQGRADVFWSAIFHSNEEYAKLWGQYMQGYIAFDDLQTVRAVYAVLRPVFDRNCPQLNADFQEQTGTSVLDMSAQLMDNWSIITGVGRADGDFSEQYIDEQREAAKAAFAKLLQQFIEFANSNDIEPRPAVLDNAIFGHHFRHYANHQEP